MIENLTLSLMLGNLFGLLCGVFCTASTFGKDNKQMMRLQCLDCSCGIISCIILRGYSGAITQSVSLVRNILVYKEKCSRIVQVILLTVILVLGIIFNNRGILGLLPIIASIEYTIVIMKTTNIKLINLSLLVNNILWLMYDFIIQNYLNMILSTIIIISSTINILNRRVK